MARKLAKDKALVDLLKWMRGKMRGKIDVDKHTLCNTNCNAREFNKNAENTQNLFFTNSLACAEACRILKKLFAPKFADFMP